MKFGIVLALLALVVSTPAFAKGHHHYRHQASRHYDGGSICARKLDSGQTIRVSCANASKFVGFLNALYRREGRLPDVTCQAWGHMPGSLHHTGNACDIGQRARNVAWRPMYHVGALASEFGLTDGCIWKHPDCGHIDVSGSGYSHYASRHLHYAYARRRRHYAIRRAPHTAEIDYVGYPH
jgi:hypothetical protein